MKIGDRQLAIIEASGEHGSGKRGPSLGSKAVKLYGRSIKNTLLENIPYFKSENNNTQFDFNDFASAKNIDKIVLSMQSTNDLLQEVMGNNYMPLIMSGDHSNAIGGVSGVSNFIDNEDLGIIWVDAHTDLHTPYTTPSGNVHGMPLAALLGLDNTSFAQGDAPTASVVNYWNDLKSIGSSKVKIKPENIVFISIRSYEKAEIEILKKYNIKCYSPADIKEKGINQVLVETNAYLSNLKHHYVSFDVDSMDPSVSEGTGTPVPNGLSLEEAHEVFSYVKNLKTLRALEITEINPLLDTKNKMSQAVFELLETFLK